jgi:hypothetical protein
VKITTQFIWHQQTSQTKMVSVGIPALTILGEELRVQNGVRSARENDEKARRENSDLKQDCSRTLRTSNISP